MGAVLVCLGKKPLALQIDRSCWTPVLLLSAVGRAVSSPFPPRPLQGPWTGMPAESQPTPTPPEPHLQFGKAQPCPPHVPLIACDSRTWRGMWQEPLRSHLPLWPCLELCCVCECAWGCFGNTLQPGWSGKPGREELWPLTSRNKGPLLFWSLGTCWLAFPVPWN